MWRWLMGGFVLLATLVAIDLSVAQVRKTSPFLPILGVIEDVQTPIMVGLIHSQTGPLAISEKSLLDAEVLALEEINAGGGVAGRLVKWSIADGRSDPATFASQANRLIETEKAAVLVGTWTAECRKAMLAVVERHEGLMIFPANFEGVEESQHILYSGGSANQVILPSVRWCVDSLRAKKFFVVGTEELWSRTVAEVAKDGIKAAGGVTVGEVYVPLVGGNAESMVEAIQAAKPDVVLDMLVGDFNISFFAAYRRAGLTPERLPVVGFNVSEEEIRRYPPGDVTGHYAGWSYFQSIDRPENLEFVRKFKIRYGQDRVVSDAMIAAHNGLVLWAQAANESGTGDPKVVMTRFDRQSLGAPDGIVTIDPFTRVAWRPFYLGKARSDGQFDVVWSIVKPIQPTKYIATRSKEQWNALVDNLKKRWGGQWSSSEPIHLEPAKLAK